MFSRKIRDNAYQERLRTFLEREYGLSISSLLPEKRGWYGETWRAVTSDGLRFIKLIESPEHFVSLCLAQARLLLQTAEAAAERTQPSSHQRS